MRRRLPLLSAGVASAYPYGCFFIFLSVLLIISIAYCICAVLDYV